MKEKKLGSKRVYECSFLTLYEDKIELPNGNESSRVWIDHPGAAAVLPITKEGNVVLVKQYRYPTQSVMLEIPAGKKDAVDETGIACVSREVEEETGMNSNDIQKVMDIHNCVGYSNELIELFVAKNCFKVENPLDADEDEFLEVYEYSKEEIKTMMVNGQITDVKTVILLQKYLYGEFD